jgi:hypothetical protein
MGSPATERSTLPGTLFECVKRGAARQVYGELFARCIAFFPGAPFVLAAALQLLGSEVRARQCSWYPLDGRHLTALVRADHGEQGLAAHRAVKKPPQRRRLSVRVKLLNAICIAPKVRHSVNV